jgi:conjugal transfer/entry exclusion protein
MPITAELDGAETIRKTVNGIDEVLLKGYVEEIDAEKIKIDEIMAEATTKAQAHRDNIKAIKKKAAENGIAKEPFEAKLRERRLTERAESCRESLSENQRDIFDEISIKLGERVKELEGGKELA